MIRLINIKTIITLAIPILMILVIKVTVDRLESKSDVVETITSNMGKEILTTKKVNSPLILKPARETFDSRFVRQIDHTADDPQAKTLPTNRIKAYSDQLKSTTAPVGEQAMLKLREYMSDSYGHRSERQQQSLNIQKLIEKNSTNGAKNNLADLPAICTSDLPGWPKPEFKQSQRLPAIKHLAPNPNASFSPIPAPKVSELYSTKLSSHEMLETVAQNQTSPASQQKFSMPTHSPKLDQKTIENYNPHAKASAASAILKPGIDLKQFEGKDPHADIYANNPYPSAVDCKACHEQIFDEWSSSSHAYSAISPMFQKFEQKINDLTQGTIGYFCMRCHAPVATTMKHRRDLPIWDGPRVYREGVTCVACHRVNEQYGKVNGERRMEPGGITAPVYGSSNGSGLEEVIQNRNVYKVKTDPDDKGIGQPIHARAIQFEQLSKSTFCMSCHQVAVDPGIKLEVVWDQYRDSPARREGTSCQNCHMGRIPGMNKGYSQGPAAVINGLAINPKRKHSNHAFYGPGYSIANPGIFPQNPKADRWSFNDWLLFDWRAGWGTDDFEDRLANNEFVNEFPEVWSNVDDRYDARDIIDTNLKKLKYKTDLRRQVMENGSKVNGPFFAKQARVGKALRFYYQVSNINRGHNMPSGSLGAQPQLWLNVVLTGPDGRRIWESGYQDKYGDLADINSQQVLDRELPMDRQLFNLQTKFLITNAKGTDREVPLPINWDIDQLPFIRPGNQPISNINHPPFIRMENHSIPPLGTRNAMYGIPANLISEPGTYRLSVRLRSRAEPMYFMRFVGATAEMMRAMNEGIVDAHPYTVAFEVQ